MSRWDEWYGKLLNGELEDRREAAKYLATVFGPPSTLPERARPALNDDDEEVRLVTARAILRLASLPLEVSQVVEVLNPYVNAGQKEAKGLFIEVARHSPDLEKVLSISFPALLRASVHCNRAVRDSALSALAKGAEFGLNVTSRLELFWSLLRDKTTAACLAARVLKSAHRGGQNVLSSDYTPAQIREVCDIKTDDIIFGLPRDCSNEPQKVSMPLSEEEEARLTHLAPEVERCLACHSIETNCIYYESYGSNAGRGSLSEYICLDCGKFSSFQWDE